MGLPAGGRSGGLLQAGSPGSPADTRIGFINRWVARLRTPRAVAFADKWGVWGGLSFGCALVGQEPILVALRWLGVEMRRIWLPLAISNAVFAVLYYAVVWFGVDQVTHLSTTHLGAPPCAVKLRDDRRQREQYTDQRRLT